MEVVKRTLLAKCKENHDILSWGTKGSSSPGLKKNGAYRDQTCHLGVKTESLKNRDLLKAQGLLKLHQIWS